MKQLGLGVTQYFQDYDETAPAGSNWYGSGNGWAGQIYPYIKSTKVFVCPSDTYAKAIASYGYNHNMVYETGGASYPTAAPPAGLALSKFTAPANSVVFFELTGNGVSGTGYDMTGVSQRAYIDATADNWPSTCGGSPCFDGYSPAGLGLGYQQYELNGQGAAFLTGGICQMRYATGYMINSTTSNAYFTDAEGRHNGGSNFVLADGHVKWLKANTVSAGYSPLTSTNCGGVHTAAGIGCKVLANGTMVAATFSTN
jgi:prepilin-type processing-associated H-X9-DG protein